jgi:hypothetical protein
VQGGAVARGTVLPSCSKSRVFGCLFLSEDALRGLAKSWKAGRSSRGPNTPWSTTDGRDGLGLHGQCLGWEAGERSGPPSVHYDDDDDGGLNVSSSGFDSDSDSDGGASTATTTSA